MKNIFTFVRSTGPCPKISIGVFLLFFFSGLRAYASDYYWVGGSGNWSDLAHWATTSGGGAHPIIVPSPGDNVIFDANSGFTVGNNVVTTNTNIYCRNMTWNNAPAAPVFNESNTYDFFVFGSLSLQANLSFNARVYFTGSVPAVVTSNGCWIRGAIEIDKAGSSLTLADDMIIQFVSGSSTLAISGDVALTTGTFDLDGHDLYANSLYSANSNVRHIDMEGSTLWFKAPIPGLLNSCTGYVYPSTNHSYVFTYGGTNKTVSAANSLIRYSSGCGGVNISGGTQLTFHDFLMDFYNGGYSSSIGNSIFNNMIMEEGIYTIGSSSGAQVDSMLFNTVSTPGYGVFNGSGTSIGTLIFNGNANAPTVNFNQVGGGSNTIGRLEFRNYIGQVSGSNNNITYAEFFDDGRFVGSNNTFGTLVFVPGYIYRFGPSTNTIITGTWYGSGNPCYLTEIVRTTTSGTATITKNGSPVNLDYVRVNGIAAAGSAAPFSAGEHSIDLGSNSNWNFLPYNPGTPVLGLGADRQVCPSAYPITLNNSGFLGSPSTSYLWSDGGTDNTMPVTGPGTYWLSVDYGRSCVYTDSITITDRFTVGFSNPVSVCNPAINNGSVTAVATGTSGPFTYSWNTVPVQNTATATGLAAGSYTVTVVDSLGCSYQATTTILGPSSGTAFNVSIPASGIFPDCDSSSTGSGAITAAITGGSAPYSILWNTVPPQNTASIYNLNPGNYLITVTDANGCQDTAAANVNAQYGLFSGAVAVTNPMGCDSTGDALVTVTGGVSPFVYAWSHNPAVLDSVAYDIIYGSHAVNVTDSNGCFLHLPFDVVGADITPPVFTGCPANLVVGNTPGTCGAVVSWVPPVASDNCGVQSVVSNHNPGDAFPLGNTLVTYTAIDILGNKHVCSFTVTVNDTQAPVITSCPGDVVITASAGNCSATAGWLPITATDNCPGAVTVTGDFVSGSSFPVGTTLVTYIATDAAGNRDTCRFRVIVKSNPANFFISSCNGSQFLYTAYNGCVSSPITLGTPVVSNLCGNYFLIPGPYAPGGTYAFPKGTNTITFRYTNTADTLACTFTVTVYDPYPPQVTGCPSPINLVADTCGGRRISWTPPNFSDNCAVASVTSNYAPGSFFPVGTTQVIYSVMDSTGNANGCSFAVTITDPAPIITGCPSNKILPADTCGGRRVTWVPPTAADNCLTSFTSNHHPGELFPVGTTTVTYTATANNGVQTTCSFTVTISPTLPQAGATCPSNQTLNLDSVTCSTPVTWVPPTFTHPCGIASVTSNHQPGDTLLPGTYTVVYTATSNDGFVANCSFSINILAAAPPITVSNCPPGGFVSVQVDTALSCGAAVAAWPVPSFSTSYCSNPVDTVILTAPVQPGDTVGLGSYIVAYDAYDSSGTLLGSCHFIFNVIDTLSRVETSNCPSDMTIQVPASLCGEAVVNFTEPQFVSYGCLAPVDSVDGNIHPGDTLAAGVHLVMYTAYDSLANVLAQCSFTVTVEDTVAPFSVVCPNTQYSAQWGQEVWRLTGDTTFCGAVANWQLPVFTTSGCSLPVDTIYSNVLPGDTLYNTQNVYYDAYDSLGNYLGGCSFRAVIDFSASTISWPADTLFAATSPMCTAEVFWDLPIINEVCATGTYFNINNISQNWWANGGNPYQNSIGQLLPPGVYTFDYSSYSSFGPGPVHTFTLTVADGSLPTFGTTCSSDTVLINSEYNTCFGLAAWPEPTAISGICGAATPLTPTSNYAPGDVLPIGNTTITYTATSTGGASATCSFVATVVDVQAPVFLACPSDMVLNPPAGDCSALATWSVPQPFDNCPGVTVTASHTPNTVFPIGTSTVTYVATDAAGNADTCSFTVTVNGAAVLAVSGCPSDTTLAAVSNCQAPVSWTAPTAAASGTCNGGPITVTASHTPGDLFSVGTTLVTYTFTDTVGNSAQCAFTVTITDNQGPVFTACPSDTLLPADAGICGAMYTWTMPTAVDSCGSVLSVTSNYVSGHTFPVGTTTVTYTATDDAGQTSTCTFTVTVNDTEAPATANCPSDIAATVGYNQCFAVVTWASPTFTDNCAIVSVTASHVPGTVFAVGTTAVTYVATDASGNVDSCTFNVTVSETQAPVFISCPINITVSATAGACGANVNWQVPVALDNCVGTVVAGDHTPGSLFAVGTTLVTYTATDAAGNRDTCTFTVTVLDGRAPVMAGCPTDITVSNAAGTCGATVIWVAPTATDNCSGVTLTSTYASGSTFPVGMTTVTYTATDSAGNTVTCSFEVTVKDIESPSIAACPANITLAASAGTCGAPATWMAPTATDNCSGLTFTSNYASGATFPVGTSVVIYTATDAAGNISTCSFTVTVTDGTAPVITGCPANITLAASAGTCGAPATWTAPTATDNCLGLTFTSNYASGATFPVGTTVVTYTAADAAGNVSTCSFTVTVTDNTVPVAVACPANLTLAAGFNQCFAIANWTAPAFTDNCMGVTVSASQVPGTVFPIGTTTVTYTATDAAGNIGTCSFTVTVTENQAPIFFFCPSDITVAANVATCGANVSWPVPQAFDNCGGTQVTASHTPGTLFPVGSTAVSYTAADVAGNQTVCTFTITVTDASAPVITGCPANVLLTATPGLCGATATWTAPTATDACGTPTVVSNANPGDLFTVGVTAVTYTFTDAAGNAATCTFTVTVNDTEEPSISNCPANLTVPATAGQCGANVSWTAPTAADNCSSLLTFTADHASGDFFPVGTTTVTYTAGDSSGNKATCVFLVTVTDTELPILLNCPTDVTVQAANNCESIATWTPPTVSDNCSGTVALLASHLPGSHFAAGTTTVTYTAMDGAGNMATCSFNVMVTDTVAPLTITCPGDIESCDHFPYWVEPTFTDNCNTVLGITTDHYPATYFATGVTSVTYTATDAGGNTATCSFSVAVSEVVLSPVADANCGTQSGTATVTVEGGLAPYTFAWSNGSADSLQTNVQGGPLTVTVTDANGCAETLAVQIPFGTALELVTSSVVQPDCGSDNGSITVNVQGGNGTIQYTWSTGATQPYVAGLAPGNYTVSAMDDNGCSDTLAVSLDCTFRIPQLVTPNGDSHNDTWMIPGIEKYPGAVVEIFNRWGNRVFYASPYANDWGGLSAAKATLGKRELPAGTYFYVIKLTPDSEALSGYLELQY